MHLAFLKQLYGHMEWADAVIWRTAYEHNAALKDDFVLDSLIHLHFVQRAYLHVWRGESTPSVGRDDFPQPAGIREWARTYYPAVTDFLAGLTDDRLSEVVPIPWVSFIEKEIGMAPSPAVLGEMLFQVTSHSVHHRAQINRRLRELGANPNMVDYIGWVWRGHPAPEW